jgi:hypothetical protein
MAIADVLAWISTHWIWSIVLGSFLVGILSAVAQNLGILAGYVLVVLLAASVAWVMQDFLYLWAFLLGALTAFTEIISKFRDEPIKSFRTKEALFYHAFNGAISMFALYVLMLYWKAPAEPLDQMKAVLVAGLGAMLIMRSRLFNIKLEKEDISFGPEQFVKVFLRFMEQAIDRVRAQARVEFVRKSMDSIDASKVEEYSLTMLEASQALDEKKKEDMKQKIPKICREQGDKQLKSYRLGFLLLDEMGEDFVERLFADPQPEWLFRARVPRESEGLRAIVGLGPQKELVSYFAYGRTMSTSQMLQRLQWTASDANKVWEKDPPRRARLEKHRLVFGVPVGDPKGHGVLATIAPADDEQIEGVLYSLPATALSFLLKPYEPGFQRSVVTVKVDQGEKRYEVAKEAFTWIAEVVETAPSHEYLDLMLAGARQHRLSQEYVGKLERLRIAPATPTVATPNRGTVATPSEQ